MNKIHDEDAALAPFSTMLALFGALALPLALIRLTLGLPRPWVIGIFALEALIGAGGLSLKPKLRLGAMVFLVLLSALLTVLMRQSNPGFGLIYLENFGVGLGRAILPVGIGWIWARGAWSFRIWASLAFVLHLVVTAWVVGNSNFFVAPAQMIEVLALQISFLALFLLTLKTLNSRVLLEVLAKKEA